MEGNHRMGMVGFFTFLYSIPHKLTLFTFNDCVLSNWILQAIIDSATGAIADVACEVEIVE